MPTVSFGFSAQTKNQATKLQVYANDFTFSLMSKCIRIEWNGKPKRNRETFNQRHMYMEIVKP